MKKEEKKKQSNYLLIYSNGMIGSFTGFGIFVFAYVYAHFSWGISALFGCFVSTLIGMLLSEYDSNIKRDNNKK